MKINKRETPATVKKNKKNLLIAMEHTLGVVTSACKICKISRDSFYRYYNSDEEFAKLIDDIDNITMDFVENQLFKAIKDGNMHAIQFYMKYKGKKRGYVHSNDITSNGQTINIKYE